MQTETRTTDAEARLRLPTSFANVTVIVEQVNETELRVRLAESSAEQELPFIEESPPLLSNRDRDHFLDLLANAPAPTPALKAAAARFKARRG